MPLDAGSRIGPYEIVGWLGAGGMGEVYRARDPRLARDVAIKLLPDSLAADPSRLHRFEQEARAVGQLNHPNILAIYDVGTHAGAPYIVSELLEGQSLHGWLVGGALTPRKALEYARQVADGLAAAHDKGIVHRDLKPDNLFVTSSGRVKILDFGIAKLTRPSDEMSRSTGEPTETAEGMMIGTAGYMSPEQVRGEPIDTRSDIFSFGTVLYEMLTGRAAFRRATGAETIAAILKDDPPDPIGADVPAALVRIISRCLEKSRDARFQSARDLAFALEFLSGARSTSVSARALPALRKLRPLLGVAVVVLSLIVAAVSWFTPRTAPGGDNPLEHATFSPLTNWEGAEEGAEISPDGRFVAFLSDRDGEYDIWLSQIGTGQFENLTKTLPPLAAMGFIVRKLGFTADGSQLWFNPADNRPLVQMPLATPTPRPILREGANTPAWSPSGGDIVYVYKAGGDDPVYLADGTGADPQVIVRPDGLKTMNPVWSPDGQWIYFTRGPEPLQDEMTMDVWRVRPSGESLERLSTQSMAANFLAPLDARTLLYVGRAPDLSGPWLWAFDVERRTSRRVTQGIEQYTSVSSSRDGRRVVATVTNPSAGLWQVPVRTDRPADEREVQAYTLRVPTGLARAPRFGSSALFYLSARGTRDGLWKVQDGQGIEVWSGVDGALSEPCAVSPDGTRIAVIVRREGKRRLMIMSADGTGAQTLAPALEIEGAPGQGAVDWSPDGTRIVAGGRDANGAALFVIAVDSGVATRIRDGPWGNPVWSPRDDLIIYAGRSLIGQVTLLGIRPDGTAVELPPVQARPGGYRFLPSGQGVVFVARIPSLDFSLLDLTTKTSRQITRLGNHGALRTFDITRDGRHIVFDRSKQNSNIVLIQR